MCDVDGLTYKYSKQFIIYYHIIIKFKNNQNYINNKTTILKASYDVTKLNKSKFKLQKKNLKRVIQTICSIKYTIIHKH